MVSENLLKDSEVVEEILQKCQKSEIPTPSGHLNPMEVGDYLKIFLEEGPNIASKKFPAKKAKLAEAVIQVMGRPAILIQDNSFRLDGSGPLMLDTWAERLEKSRINIERAIRSVGRIEVTNHPDGFAYIGTGWLVSPSIIVTNRHVAKEFAWKSTKGFVFRKNPFLDRTIGVNIDFREEYGIDAHEQFEVLEVLYFEEDENGPDIAFLRISSNTIVAGNILGLPNPIPLYESQVQNAIQIAVIGYPIRDSRRNLAADPNVNEIFGDIYDVKRLQPGEVMSVQPKYITHDCSTSSGNSGSVVIDLETGNAIGLH